MISLYFVLGIYTCTAPILKAGVYITERETLLYFVFFVSTYIIANV